MFTAQWSPLHNTLNQQPPENLAIVYKQHQWKTGPKSSRVSLRGEEREGERRCGGVQRVVVR